MRGATVAVVAAVVLMAGSAVGYENFDMDEMYYGNPYMNYGMPGMGMGGMPGMMGMDPYGMPGRMGLQRMWGVVDLDDGSFGAVAYSGRPVFVYVFDGDAEDELDVDSEIQSVAEEFGGNHGIVIAKLDAASSVETAKKLAVDLSKRNVYFFVDGENVLPDSKAILTTAEDMIAAVYEHSSVPHPGCLPELKLPVSQFMKSTDGAYQSSIIESVKTTVENMDADHLEYGKYYAKMMEKILENGHEAITKEADRINRMLEGKDITDAKKRTFSHRINILQEFLGALEE